MFQQMRLGYSDKYIEKVSYILLTFSVFRDEMMEQPARPAEPASNVLKAWKTADVQAEEEDIIPLFIEEPYDHTKKPQYDKHKVMYKLNC